MDTSQWPQAIVGKPMEETIATNTTCTSSVEMNKGSSSTSLERKARPQKDEASNCPRCNSTNTKFCYYNNYSLTQPRYFCKTCRRYWTEGGSLRNIPVGGGSRKNKRSSSNYFSNQNNNNNPSSISPPQSSSKKLALDPTHSLVNIVPNSQITPNPKWIHNHQPQDLNLGFPQNALFMETTTNTTQIPNSSPNHQPQDLNLVFPQNTQNALFIENTPKTTQIPNHHQHHQQQVSALELLNGLTSSRGLTPFMPMSMSIHNPNGVYSSSGFPTLMQDFKPSINNNTLNFSLDHGFGGNLNGYGGNLQQEEGNNNNNGRLLFPFEDLKQVSSNNTTSAHDHNQNDSTTNDHDHDHHDHQQTTREQGDSNGYWSGMLGMGGSW